MKACPGQSGTGLVLYDAWAVPGVITDMCCLLKFTDHYPQPPESFHPAILHDPGCGRRLARAAEAVNGVALR